MNEQYRCGDHEALIACVYGEADASDRERVAAHLATCAACTDELEALRSTRQALAAWAPPEPALGFRITNMPDLAPAPVLRPAAWWRQPLPAWAQAAAALLIFAAGVAIGGGRPAADVVAGGGTVAAMPAPAAVTPAPAVSRDAVSRDVVSRDDLARLEQRLLAVEAARTRDGEPRVVSASAVDENALIERVASMIEASEQRQRIQDVRLAQAVNAVAEDIEVRRRADLERVERRMGQIYSPTEQVLRQHSAALAILASYPQSGGAR